MSIFICVLIIRFKTLYFCQKMNWKRNSIFHEKFNLIQFNWTCSSRLMLMFIRIYKNCFIFQDKPSLSFGRKLLKLEFYLLRFLENRIIVLFCKFLSDFQRFRKYRDKTFALLDLKVLFCIKMIASIWKKQLAK